MTTERFTPNYQDHGPEPVGDNEIQMEGPEEIGLEVEEKNYRRLIMPLAAILILVLFGATIFMGVRGFSPQMMMMPLMMMFMVMGGAGVANAATGKSDAQMDGTRAEYLRYLSGGLRTRVAKSARQQMRYWTYHGPNPNDLSALINKGARQWSRQKPAQENPSDLFMTARVGTGNAPAEDKLLRPVTGAGTDPTNPQLAGPSIAPSSYLEPVMMMWMIKFIRTHSLISNCPKLISLSRYPTISLGGDPENAKSVLRAAIMQLAYFQGPDALEIRVKTKKLDPEWAWLKWLPHTQHRTEKSKSGPLRLFYPDDDALNDITTRGAHMPDNLPAGPYILVLNLDGTTGYPMDGKAGVTYLTLCPPQPNGRLGGVSSQYHLRVDEKGALEDNLRIKTKDRKPGWKTLGQADTVTVKEAETFARRLSRWSITGEHLKTAARPQAKKVDSGWLALVGAKTLQDVAPHTWQEIPDNSQERLKIPFGHRYDTGEVIYLDIKEAGEFGMGPHGLCIGMSGSGKTETIRTLLLSLIARTHPNQVNIVVVDFKGGAGVQDMADVPHMAAIITDLPDSNDMVARFADAMSGELQRRKQILTDAFKLTGQAVGDFAVYEKLRQAGHPLPPVPALFVVVDEFAALINEHPEFMDQFVHIGRQGRSNRVHLLLASQEAANGEAVRFLTKIDANIGYRMALHTASIGESKAVIGTPEAYFINKDETGVGYIKIGSDDPIQFRSTYTGVLDAIDDNPPPTVEDTTSDQATKAPLWTPTVGLFTPQSATTRIAS
ncbi:type VII secretion protein EccCa [Mycobacteroides salmoniphilum]|uniref:ESX-1 secretion system protein EccCa1 n=1 Tax=Mycobacteroides salmoniphilum TaxID=404941 RepID=A0A4R8SZW0_9MYCO|nr:type VII secretion protein EccCa [Mycobacteroides salmoniphilum]TEA09167.1 ESX-1 secretion system protein EccCa1 [Mycobacteroides salmoniphilum]